MVTLIGFMFILVNIVFLEIWMPDLVGPVRTSHLIHSFIHPCPIMIDFFGFVEFFLL